MSRTGVLLLGFGGPESIDSVRPFMCNLMDREPSDELVETVCRRYLAIGGGSPLPDIAESIAEGLEERLGQSGSPAPVRVGMRYWHPFIADAVAELMHLGCDRIVTFSLSPFESKAASGAYREAIETVVAEHGHLEIVEAPLLSKSEEFIDYFAGSTAVALEDLVPNNGAVVVFTAHSLPEADLIENDPYVEGLEDVAQEIAKKLGMALGHPGAGAMTLEGFTALGSTADPRAWFLVYQSKGARPGGWLGPQLEDLIPAVAASDYTAIVVVPIGFATDHMETLYDLDIVAAGAALDADLEFMRARVPNDDPRILDAIAKVVAPLI
jgi:protoporphyrin/coproporphyrin ferrochelatase